MDIVDLKGYEVCTIIRKAIKLYLFNTGIKNTEIVDYILKNNNVSSYQYKKTYVNYTSWLCNKSRLYKGARMDSIIRYINVLNCVSKEQNHKPFLLSEELKNLGY